VIAWIKGTAVKISPNQLPELHKRFQFCCQQLGMAQMPEAYLLHGNGMFNAFATRFFGRNFVVLLSDVVDAMEDQPDGINFYIGHELGHIRRGHLTGHIWRAPALWLPLIGAAYSRAKEYTCDLHGRACCANAESAARALVALAAGAHQWRQVNLADYAGQSRADAGFWASFHELIGGYPWLTKRVARAVDPDVQPPKRNPLAYVLALFVPYGGRLAGGTGVRLIVVVAIIGILAARALPAYQYYTTRAKVLAGWSEASAARTALSAYYGKHQEIPPTLAAANVPERLPSGAALKLDTNTMTVNLTLPQGVLKMVPMRGEKDAIIWRCQAGDGLSPWLLPRSCSGQE